MTRAVFKNKNGEFVNIDCLKYYDFEDKQAVYMEFESMDDAPYYNLTKDTYEKDNISVLDSICENLGEHSYNNEDYWQVKVNFMDRFVVLREGSEAVYLINLNKVQRIGKNEKYSEELKDKRFNKPCLYYCLMQGDDYLKLTEEQYYYLIRMFGVEV